MEFNIPILIPWKCVPDLTAKKEEKINHSSWHFWIQNKAYYSKIGIGDTKNYYSKIHDMLAKGHIENWLQIASNERSSLYTDYRNYEAICR